MKPKLLRDLLKQFPFLDGLDDEMFPARCGSATVNVVTADLMSRTARWRENHEEIAVPPVYETVERTFGHDSNPLLQIERPELILRIPVRRIREPAVPLVDPDQPLGFRSSYLVLEGEFFVELRDDNLKPTGEKISFRYSVLEIGWSVPGVKDPSLEEAVRTFRLKSSGRSEYAGAKPVAIVEIAGRGLYGYQATIYKWPVKSKGWWPDVLHPVTSAETDRWMKRVPFFERYSVVLPRAAPPKRVSPACRAR